VKHYADVNDRRTKSVTGQGVRENVPERRFGSDNAIGGRRAFVKSMEELADLGVTL
jgi:hypothetical protein